MFREAKEYGLREPELIDMGSDFRVNLYRKATAFDQNGVIDPTQKNGISGTNRDTIDTIRDTIDTDSDKLLVLIKARPDITQKQMQQETGLSLSTVKRVMAQLQKNGKVVRIGNNRSGKWQIGK